MRIAICHNAIAPGARADEQDVLVQVAAVQSALHERGHSSEVIPVDLDLSRCFRRVHAARPDVLFNLVESFAGSDRLASVAVAALERTGVPLTGSSAEVLWLSNDKLLAKERLFSRGLPTPAWCADTGGTADGSNRVVARDRFILKPVGEHASLGMDADAVVQPADASDLVRRTRTHGKKIGVRCFAERFISGREFNVSLLARHGGCEVLPLAEIDFSNFPSDMLRIVDYRAKWDRDSFEFQNTPRKFLGRGSDPDLAQRLAHLATECWELFELRGYARVDFRVDDHGQPWILEINTNPCLSPDAGYAAALEQASIPLADAVERILADAFPDRRFPKGKPTVLSSPPIPTVDPPALSWREALRPDDPKAIRELVAATGFFNDEEIAIAQELADERLTKGDASGYYFVLAELDHEVAGYAAYGPIAGTRESVDLYWIAVHPQHQKLGLGRRILARTEQAIRSAGGRRVYVETSSRDQYAPTRTFYERCGYAIEAVLTDFYGPADDKVIYVRVLSDG